MSRPGVQLEEEPGGGDAAKPQVLRALAQRGEPLVPEADLPSRWAKALTLAAGCLQAEGWREPPKAPCTRWLQALELERGG